MMSPRAFAFPSVGLLLLALLTPAPGRAQGRAGSHVRDVDVAEGALVRSQEVPSPAAFHGFDLGTDYLITSAIYDYYRELARRSPRVEYAEYGRSIQGRPLPLVIVGSEANLSRQEEIRARLKRLTGVTAPLPERELEALVADLPAIVWIYIVDTDEEAGVNVLQEVAYELATREDEGGRRIRDNVLVVMTPLTNPDAQARYVTWHKLYDVDGAALDPNAVENDAHWGMNTDGNAWGIDTNRDWGTFVTPEIRATARIALDWRPQLSLDIHSGPAVLFMGPIPHPYHPLWPEEAAGWWEAVAARASQHFGARGWTFSGRDSYDGIADLGHSHSWAMLAVTSASFVYETFGGRPGMTTAFLRSDGSTATMRMAMDRHHLAIGSALEIAAERREDLLRDAHRRVIAAVDAARGNPVRAVVIPSSGPGVDPHKVARLVDRLTHQGVDVRRAVGPFRETVRDFLALGTESARDFPAGSYVVDFVQPQARLARALLDPELGYGNPPSVEATFARKMPYSDVTWGNLSYLFGVPSFAAREVPRVESEPVTGPQPVEGRFEDLGRPGAPYAYLIPPGTEANYRVAVRLLRDGHRLRVFRRGLRIGDRSYPAGTMAALRDRNGEALPERVRNLATELGGHVVEVAGPYTDGGASFGNEQLLAAIPQPRVAVLADWPVPQDHVFGGIRSVLEGDFGFAFSPVLLETINRGDLSPYTAVVLPHGGMSMRGGPNFGDGYGGRLGLENLREYVRRGGTLVAVKGAAEAVASDPVLGGGVATEGWAERTNGAVLLARWEVGSAPSSRLVPWQPGVGELDATLLAAGYERQEFAAPGAYPVLLSVDEGSGAKVVARYGADPSGLVLEGFVHDSDLPVLAGRPLVVVQPVGRGRVVYFADSATFRGYWYGLNTLFLNVLLFGPLS